MNCTTLGIDVAKNIFQLHGVDERGPVVVQGLSKAPHSWHVDFCPSFGVLCRGSEAPFVSLAVVRRAVPNVYSWHSLPQ